MVQIISIEYHGISLALVSTRSNDGHEKDYRDDEKEKVTVPYGTVPYYRIVHVFLINQKISINIIILHIIIIIITLRYGTVIPHYFFITVLRYFMV